MSHAPLSTAGLAPVDLAQQVAPAAQEVLVGKLPAVGVHLAEALQARQALQAWRAVFLEKVGCTAMFTRLKTGLLSAGIMPVCCCALFAAIMQHQLWVIVLGCSSYAHRRQPRQQQVQMTGTHICVQLAHERREVVVLEVHGKQVTSKLSGLPDNEAASTGRQQRRGDAGGVFGSGGDGGQQCGRLEAPRGNITSFPRCWLFSPTFGRPRPMKQWGPSLDRPPAHICVQGGRQSTVRTVQVSITTQPGTAPRGSRLGEEWWRGVAALLRFGGCGGVGTTPAGVHEAVHPPNAPERASEYGPVSGDVAAVQVLA